MTNSYTNAVQFCPSKNICDAYGPAGAVLVEASKPNHITGHATSYHSHRTSHLIYTYIRSYSDTACTTHAPRRLLWREGCTNSGSRPAAALCTPAFKCLRVSSQETSLRSSQSRSKQSFANFAANWHKWPFICVRAFRGHPSKMMLMSESVTSDAMLKPILSMLERSIVPSVGDEWSSNVKRYGIRA